MQGIWDIGVENLMKKTFVIIGILTAIIAFTGIGIWRAQQQKPEVMAESVANRDDSSSGMPTVGGPFKLIDQNGMTRSDDEFNDKPMLIYFGYAYCPDICPMGLSNITHAIEKIGDGRIYPIFITVDPERDTVEQLKTYSTNFHKSFTMLTGSVDAIESAKKAYRVYSAKAQENRGVNDYIVDHSSVIYFMDKGQFVHHFNHQTPADEMATYINQYLETREK